MLNSYEAQKGSSLPWMIEVVEDKLNKINQGLPLESLEIKDDSFEKLILYKMTPECFPLEVDVVSRLA